MIRLNKVQRYAREIHANRTLGLYDRYYGHVSMPACDAGITVVSEYHARGSIH